MSLSTHEANGHGSATGGDAARLEAISHAHSADCYQCGKCSAGCPMADKMDLLPNQLVRLVQMGKPERALKSQAIWLCVSCQTCAARCPKSVDCAGLMDALRQVAVEKDLAAPAFRRTVQFQQAFLDNIRRNGRLAEVELIAHFKARAFLGELNLPFLFKDTLLGPKMLRRGKLHLLPGKARDRGVVDRIFQRCLSGKE